VRIADKASGQAFKRGEWARVYLSRLDSGAQSTLRAMTTLEIEDGSQANAAGCLNEAAKEW